MAAIRREPAATSSGSSTSTGKQNNGKKWHWNCAAALCTNNWRNKNLTYYTLAKIGSSTDAALRASYMKVLTAYCTLRNEMGRNEMGRNEIKNLYFAKHSFNTYE